MNLDEEASICVYITVLDKKMYDLFNEDWGNSTDPDHEAVLTRWLYEGAIRDALKESLEIIRKGGVK